MALSTKPAKIFTVEQANACLPLVRSIVADIVTLSRELRERRQRLEQLAAGRKGSRDDYYGEELEQVEDDLEKDVERLQGYAQELLDLGIEPKDLDVGLVDFPCVMDGRLAYLCWKHGEPTVQYWHDLDAGFQGRKALPG